MDIGKIASELATLYIERSEMRSKNAKCKQVIKLDALINGFGYSKL